MTRLFILALLFPFSFCYAQLQNPINISCLDAYWDTEHRLDSAFFPMILISDSLIDYIKKSSTYPELGKKRKLSTYVILKLEIDTIGKISNLTVLGDSNPIFDSAAIHLAMKTSGHWQAAIRDGTKTKTSITTVVGYEIERNNANGIDYYAIMPGLDEFIIDSSQNSPACLFLPESNMDGDYKKFYFTHIEIDASKVMFAQNYGTVTIAFTVDTLGKLNDVKVLNSISKSLDADALKFINKTESKWVPATKNGKKVESYVEFDFNYFQKIPVTDMHKAPNRRILYKSHNFDRNQASRLINEKEFKLAIPILDKICNYFIRDPEVFFMRGFCYLNLEEIEKACDDLSYTIFLSEKYGFPKSINKEKINGFIVKYCGVVEKENVEEK